MWQVRLLHGGEPYYLVYNMLPDLCITMGSYPLDVRVQGLFRISGIVRCDIPS